MKKLIYLTSMLTVCMLMFNSCKEKEENPPVSSNVLCDGNGSSSIYPLANKSTWKYIFKKDGKAEPESPELEVLKDSFINGKIYKAFIDSSETIYGALRFYRQDASSGDIYYYTSSYADEYLEVPGSPKLNQEWSYIFWSRKVTNLSASVKTGACNYSGLTEVTEYDGSTVKKTMYFKKGLGLVYQKYPPVAGVVNEFILSGVSLK